MVPGGGVFAVHFYLGCFQSIRLAVMVGTRDRRAEAVQVRALVMISVWYGVSILTVSPAQVVVRNVVFPLGAACFALVAWYVDHFARTVARQSAEIVQADKHKYDTRWAELLSIGNNRQELSRLQTALSGLKSKAQCIGGDVNGGLGRLRAETIALLHRRDNSFTDGDAAQLRKPKQVTGDLPYLFAQAAVVNPIFQTRLSIWAGRTEGVGVHHASVKQHTRAIQKIWRCYGGDATYLLDLVRGSIVCNAVHELIECLGRIGADPAVFVLHTKNRFDPEYDGKLTAGYRNLALVLVLIDKSTVRLGVHDHVCELQLALASMDELKTTGGHTNYRKWRNIRAV